MCDPEALVGRGAPAAAPDGLRVGSPALGTVHVSAGTAAVIGLHAIRQMEVPSMAYLMVGERCSQDCAFCAQARTSRAQAGFLSRVAWPDYPLQDTLLALAASCERQEIRRCCLQITVSPGYVQRATALVRQLKACVDVPVCVSIVPPDLETVRALLEAGAERVALAMDAACENIHRVSKGGSWQAHLDLLHRAAQQFPGHIGTHLIAGLGETEREMVTVLQNMVLWQVTVGLFAFTPVAGTRWATRKPPTLSSYRRIQAAWYLLRQGTCRVDSLEFSASGQILSYGLEWSRMRELLAEGTAFRTAGCPDCNRPYYNERPGRTMYNYPRSLSDEERSAAVSEVLQELVGR